MNYSENKEFFIVIDANVYINYFLKSFLNEDIQNLKIGSNPDADFIKLVWDNPDQIHVYISDHIVNILKNVLSKHASDDIVNDFIDFVVNDLVIESDGEYIPAPPHRGARLKDFEDNLIADIGYEVFEAQDNPNLTVLIVTNNLKDFDFGSSNVKKLLAIAPNTFNRIFKIAR